MSSGAILHVSDDGFLRKFRSDGSSFFVPVKATGYHTRHIDKGRVGEISKITEEYQELMDANSQDNPVMELVELTDLLGAIEAYSLEKYKISMNQLLTMTRATQRAFQYGHRK